MHCVCVAQTALFTTLLAALCVRAAPLDEPGGAEGPNQKPIAILKLASDRSPDGAFSYE